MFKISEIFYNVEKYFALSGLNRSLLFARGAAPLADIFRPFGAAALLTPDA